MLYDLLLPKAKTSFGGRGPRRGCLQPRTCRVENLENRCLLTATTAMTLLAPTPILYGQSETITATVTPTASNANSPTGTITIPTTAPL